jgi:hypothetical protein
MCKVTPTLPNRPNIDKEENSGSFIRHFGASKYFEMRNQAAHPSKSSLFLSLERF